jgi:GNAT superfamily N-acetyltransferase
MLSFRDEAGAADELCAAASYRYVTPAGMLYVREHCPRALLERLKPDPGLRAFARRPEREYELLLRIVEREQGELTLAYTGEGLIVGQLTVVRAGDWWEEIESCFEVAIEVSENWRQLGVASRLIALAAAREDLEDRILLAMGLAWHWDLERSGFNRIQYRDMLVRLVAPYGFTEYLTTEPNIRDDPSNVLLARLGSRVPSEKLNRFYTCLLRSERLPGLP